MCSDAPRWTANWTAQRAVCGLLALQLSACQAPTFLPPDGPPRGLTAPSALFTPEQFGADPTGTIDSTAAIQAALTAAVIVKGTVQMCGRYLQTSANITQPQAVAVVGCESNFPGASWASRNYTTTGSTVIQNPRYTWNVGLDARLARLTFQRAGLSAPSSFASLAAAATSNLQGTAITLTGSDIALDDLLILGYAVGVFSNGQSRFNLYRVNIDATNCISINGMYDIATIDTMECYPFTTYNTLFGNATWPVTAETTDGSGQVVLTIGGPSVSGAALVTGYPVNVIGPNGQPGVTNHYTISVSGDKVTLIGSRLNPTTTATFVPTSNQISVSNPANIGVGQRVTGSGIVAGTTVAAVNYRANLVTLSRAPSESQTNTALAFISPAYTAGGSVRFEELRRTGDGITIANAYGLRVLSPFVLGHDIGYHARTNAQGTLFVNAQTDYDVAAQDPQSAAYAEDGPAAFSMFMGGFLNSEAFATVLNRTPGSFQAPSTFTGTMLASSGGYIIWANSGRASFTGSPQSAAGGQVYVGANMNSLVLAGNDWQGTPAIQYQTPASASRVMVAGAQLTGVLQFDGGTGNGPRIHASGPSGLNGYLSLPGPNASWFLGSDADGYSFAVVDPGAPSMNTPTVSAGTGAPATPALFRSSNGSAQFTSAGSFSTLLGSPSSLSAFQGGVGLSASSDPVYNVAARGATVALSAYSMMTLITGASTLASLTLQYPAAPTDRQLECFTTQVAITALTLASAGNAAFDDSITSSPAHATICQRFYASVGANGTWVHEKPQ